MNTAVNVNVVHESEAQRQHARVRIPAKLRYLDSERQPQDEQRGTARDAGGPPGRIADR